MTLVVTILVMKISLPMTTTMMFLVMITLDGEDNADHGEGEEDDMSNNDADVY